MLQYSREINNRGLINPANGLLPNSIASPISLEANPLQRYITGQDVIADYQLHNIDNERVMLAKIDDRNNEEALLDSSNINPAKIDQDLVEQMLYEDRQNPGANYMGLDSTDFVREANKSSERSEEFKRSLVLLKNQNEMMESVRDLTRALTNSALLAKDTKELVNKVMIADATDTTDTTDEPDAIKDEPEPQPPIIAGYFNRRELWGLN